MANQVKENPGPAGDPPKCPGNIKWLKAVADFLPEGMSPKIDRFRECLIERKPVAEEAPPEEGTVGEG